MAQISRSSRRTAYCHAQKWVALDVLRTTLHFLTSWRDAQRREKQVFEIEAQLHIRRWVRALATAAIFDSMMEKLCRVINYIWSSAVLLGGLLVIAVGISKGAYVLPSRYPVMEFYVNFFF